MCYTCRSCGFVVVVVFRCTLFYKNVSEVGAEAIFLRFKPENVLNMFLNYRLNSTTN